MSSKFYVNVVLFLFQEVGSIIGKKGEIVKRFRDEVSHDWFINLMDILTSILCRSYVLYGKNISLHVILHYWISCDSSFVFTDLINSYELFLQISNDSLLTYRTVSRYNRIKAKINVLRKERKRWYQFNETEFVCPLWWWLEAVLSYHHQIDYESRWVYILLKWN